MRVVRQLHGVEATRAERCRELAERAGFVVRHAQLVDSALVAFALQPLQVLTPGHQVVYLLDLDATEPLDLARVLLAPLLDRRRPDLRRHGCTLTAPLERTAERSLRAAIHRRRIED